MDEEQHVHQRIGDLEGWAKSVDRRFDEISKRMDKQDTNLQRIWERLDMHRDGQVKTQTLVEVGNRDISELKVQMSENAKTQTEILQALGAQAAESESKAASKWEGFYSKAFWVIVTAVIAYVGYAIFGVKG